MGTWSPGVGGTGKGSRIVGGMGTWSWGVRHGDTVTGSGRHGDMVMGSEGLGCVGDFYLQGFYSILREAEKSPQASSSESTQCTTDILKRESGTV